MGIFKKQRDKNGRPTGAWFIQYPVERDPATGRIRYKTKRASWHRKKAEEILRKKQDEFYERAHLGVRVDADLTFSELMDWGLPQEVMKAKRSAGDDGARARYLKAHFGSCKAAQVTPLMVENFRGGMRRTISERTGKPYSGTSVNKMVSLARRIYYLAMKGGMLAANPFARCGKFKESSKGKYIPDTEFWKIYPHLPEYGKPVTLSAYLTGMRRGEILGLRWDQVDRSEGVIELPPESTKTKEPRRIYYGALAKLRELFDQLPKGRGDRAHVFTWEGKAVQPMAVYRGFRKACKEAGVGPYRFHDLRHTFNDNMRRAGVGRETIMALTGQKTVQMYLHYCHVDREEARAAMDRFGRHLAQNSAGAETGVAP